MMKISKRFEEFGRIAKLLALGKFRTMSVEHGMSSLRSRVAALEQNYENELARQLIHTAARNLANRGDHRIILGVERRIEPLGRPLRIGFFGNLANQSYLTVRALRRLGHDAELVIQSNNIDSYPLSRLFWEEQELEIDSLDDDRLSGEAFALPDFVRDVPCDFGAAARFRGRLSATEEVIDLYRGLAGRELQPDEALVLAQWMGQWDYLKAMADYDVVHLSMWPICLAQFSPRPTVVCPLGGDLYITGFEQNLQGLVCRAGFRMANHIQVCETDYPAFLDRMEAKGPRSFLPLMVDTDVYKPGAEDGLRTAWQQEVGGEHFLLSVCRQDWLWKGSDKLIRAFARFCQGGNHSWRLLLQAWGNDLDRSRALVTKLGLDGSVVWLSMCSKPLLRRRQRAADVVADQFVMEGYGASVFESLAAAKPVIMSPVPPEAAHHFRTGAPPLVGARSEEEIMDAIIRMSDAGARARIGDASRAWVLAEHGYQVLAPRYMEMFEAAYARGQTSNGP